MFKYEIPYTDYNGVERKETCYFNLSKAELMEMELSTQAGVEEMIRVLIAERQAGYAMNNDPRYKKKKRR